MNARTENLTALTGYAQTLVAAGLEVWLTEVNYSTGGWLTYRDPATDSWGTLQHSDHDGWQHLMPIKPSPHNGSSMHLDTPTDPFTVEAARECARPTNRNRVIGTQANHPAYLSPSAQRVEA